MRFIFTGIFVNPYTILIIKDIIRYILRTTIKTNDFWTRRMSRHMFRQTKSQRLNYEDIRNWIYNNNQELNMYVYIWINIFILEINIYWKNIKLHNRVLFIFLVILNWICITTNIFLRSIFWTECMQYIHIYYESIS